MGVRLRLKKGHWYTVVNHEGKRISKMHSTRDAANEFKRDIEAGLARGDWALPNRKAPTVGALADELLKTHEALKGVKVGTMENYASTIKAHVRPAFGDLPVTALTPRKIEEWIAAKRAPGGSVRFPARGIGSRTIGVALTALGLICKRAVRDGYVRESPLAKLDRRRADAARMAAPDPFDVSELQAILRAAEAIDPDWRVFLEFWARSGMRRGEVLALTWGDLDLSRGEARVSKTWSRRRLQDSTKTGRARTVSFCYPLPEAGPEWRPGSTPESRAFVERVRGLTVRGLGPEAVVFRDFAGRDPDGRRWKRTVTRAGVRYRCGETFRHSFASGLLSRGANLLHVQKAGGWTNATVLLKHYAASVEQGEALQASSAPTGAAVAAVARA
jgi:integrase